MIKAIETTPTDMPTGQLRLPAQVILRCVKLTFKTNHQSNNALMYNLAIPLLGILSKECRSYHKDICITFNVLFYILCVLVFCLHEYMCIICMPGAVEARRYRIPQVRSYRWLWDTNLGLLEEQPKLFTTEPSLQSQWKPLFTVASNKIARKWDQWSA